MFVSEIEQKSYVCFYPVIDFLNGKARIAVIYLKFILVQLVLHVKYKQRTSVYKEEKNINCNSKKSPVSRLFFFLIK
jgi:hypothetical protein